MRLYLKILLMIVVFVCVSSSRFQRFISDRAYEARVAYVFHFGSAADYAALVDDTQHMLARETGNLERYLRGKRYEQLLAEYLAHAARTNTPVSEDDLQRISAEAFSSSRYISANGSESMHLRPAAGSPGPPGPPGPIPGTTRPSRPQSLH